ncbi:MAG TPA: hypothetical protein PLA74_04900 [Syntrophales bacterium]|nr:hypothetical protein [Syntrophales bacterium]HPQ42603.1 hypothetical protein [Syntrophales bacterium]
MDNHLNQLQLTPKEITKDILAFCKEIDPNTNPLFVSVNPTREVRFNYCLTDVPKYAMQHGGKAIFGWIIWELQGLLLEAEFHTCFEGNNGKLIDITPKSDGNEYIVFLPDSYRVYQGKFMKGFRKKLIDNEVAQMYCKLAEKLDQLREKHFRNDEYDADAVDYEFQEWIAQLDSNKEGP